LDWGNPFPGKVKFCRIRHTLTFGQKVATFVEPQKMVPERQNEGLLGTTRIKTKPFTAAVKSPNWPHFEMLVKYIKMRMLAPPLLFLGVPLLLLLVVFIKFFEKYRFGLHNRGLVTPTLRTVPLAFGLGGKLNTVKMEPFIGTQVVVAGNHLSK